MSDEKRNDVETVLALVDRLQRAEDALKRVRLAVEQKHKHGEWQIRTAVLAALDEGTR